MYRNTLVHRRRRTKLAAVAKVVGSFGVSFLIGGFVLRLFSYATAEETVLLFGVAAAIGLLAGAIAVLALFRIWFKGFDGLPKTLLAFLYGLIATAPALGAALLTLLTPFTNDVATLAADPPQLSLSAESIEDRAGLLGSELGEPRIVQNLYPVQSTLPVAQVSDVVRRLAREQGWRYVRASGSLTDPPYGLNYVDETMIMGFRDDIVVEMRRGRNRGTEVHMRSASRLGRGDFGTNEARIRAFLEMLAIALNADSSAGTSNQIIQVR